MLYREELDGLGDQHVALPLGSFQSRGGRETGCRTGCESVGEQNLPPQNVSLWHEDKFRLIISKKQKTQEVFLVISL